MYSSTHTGNKYDCVNCDESNHMWDKTMTEEITHHVFSSISSEHDAIITWCIRGSLKKDFCITFFHTTLKFGTHIWKTNIASLKYKFLNLTRYFRKESTICKRKLETRRTVWLCCLWYLNVFVNFSHFHLLLQNHWANFNQTWDKAPLGDGD